MRVKLLKNYKNVLRKAWSIRLMLIAGVLSSVEFILPYYADSIPRGWFSIISSLVVLSAFVARITAQRDLPDEEE